MLHGDDAGSHSNGRPVPHGPATVLVVDDEELVRALLGEFLELAGFRVVLLDGGPSTLGDVARLASQVDVVVSDIRMPATTGPEVAAIVRQQRPDAQIVYVSGMPPDAELSADMARTGAEMALKPFSPGDLVARVQRLLATRI